ncbi:MAG: hypothetical protein Q7T80_16625 [Methanoregula sp.]|nr:hypothetical protein [Methanoregula sp.]
MGDNDVSVESVEVALLSDIEQSSATMIKDAYQPDSGEDPDAKSHVPPPHPAGPPQENGSAGPNARVYMTKISALTPPEEIEKILLKKPERTGPAGSYDFHTLVLTLSLRLSDPSTTRFLNGTIVLALPRGIKILGYSPRAKGAVNAIIEHGGDVLSFTPGLDLLASVLPGTQNPAESPENRFRIPVGPEEKIAGSYRKKTGYMLTIPASALLEYQGMLKNEHEMFWEIFPPIPGQDVERSGKEMLVVFSLLVQCPKNTLPGITAHIEGRVKGNLWGVILLKGSAVL